MVGKSGGLFFGGSEHIQPSGRDDSILNGTQPDTYVADESDADEDIPYENPQTGERSRKRAASPTVNNDQAPKKVRVSGGKAAIPKRIVTDYDTDDGRIVTLKQQGYSDEYVAQKLIQEGRIRYVPKTVGSRWLRLRKALEQAENEKLDDELSDWHVEEDDKLDAAFKIIDEKFEYEMQKFLNKKWKEISANLAERIHKKKYTAKACRERYEAVQNGKALLPIEIDPDKEGRKKLRDDRIAAAKQRRDDQAAKVQRFEDEKKRKLEEKKEEADEKERNRILQTRERGEAKAETARLKQEKKNEKARIKAAKKAAAEKVKAEEEWAKTVRRKEAEIFTRMTGKKMKSAPGARRRPAGGRGRGSRRGGGARRSSREDDFIDDDDEENVITSSDSDGDEISEDESEASDVDTGLMNGSSTEHVPSSSTPAKPTKKLTTTTIPKVTKETLLSPRSVMTDAELELLLFERKLPRRTLREDHPQVVARLAAADKDLPTPELDELLRPYFDKGKGSKVAKIKRLQEHDAAKSAAGGAGLKPTDSDFKEFYEGYKGEYRSLVEE